MRDGCGCPVNCCFTFYIFYAKVNEPPAKNKATKKRTTLALRSLFFSKLSRSIGKKKRNKRK